MYSTVRSTWMLSLPEPDSSLDWSKQYSFDLNPQERWARGTMASIRERRKWSKQGAFQLREGQHASQMVRHWINAYHDNDTDKHRFGAAAESRGGNNGTTDIQIYSDITITLRDPDLDFGKTAFTSQPTVYMAPPITKDSGKSWFVRYLLIPSMARARPSEIE